MCSFHLSHSFIPLDFELFLQKNVDFEFVLNYAF